MISPPGSAFAGISQTQAEPGSAYLPVRPHYAMSDDTSQKPSAYRKMMDFIMAGEDFKRERAQWPEFFDYIESPNCSGITVEIQPRLLTEAAEMLTEATHATVGRYIARRDPPHFAGDTYHGHCDVGGGHEVSWSVTGPRRHASKFPAHVPHDAKAAVAKVLRVSPDILEAFWIDDAGGRRVLLLETRVA